MLPSAVVIALAAALSLAACGGVGAAAAPDRGGAAAASAAAALHRLPEPEFGPAVSPSAPLVGVNLYVNMNYPIAQAERFGARDLRYIARTLKLKAVSIAFDYNVPDPSSDVVTASPTRTPPIAELAAITSIARSYGLQVEYRVQFAINNSDSRGASIRPGSLTAWLSSLLATETPALQLAERDRVGEFVVGTDMATIDQSPLWGGFFARAARLYHGVLSYASWGGRLGLGGFFSPRRDLLPLRSYGASAFPSISLPPTASVARLTQAWVAFLRQAPEGLLHLTAIDDLGIPAVAGAYRAPYQWLGLGHPRPDPAVQANWYQAACQAADMVHVRALYFWGAVLSSDPATPQPSLEGFEGHPATEAAIRSCP